MDIACFCKPRCILLDAFFNRGTVFAAFALGTNLNTFVNITSARRWRTATNNGTDLLTCHTENFTEHSLRSDTS